MSSEQAIVVMVAAGDLAEAERLAALLVERRLAACVQILPQMISIYRWQGAVERSKEHLLLIKTTLERFDELEREVRATHSYETPEIITLPVTAGSSSYLAWLRDNTK